MSDSYGLLIENLPDAFAYHQLITDSDGVPVDYIILDVNKAFTVMFGQPKDRFMGKKITEVYPNIKESDFDWIGTFGKVALNGENISFEHYYEPRRCWYEVTVYRVAPGFFAVIFRDITESKKIQQDNQKERNNLAALLQFKKEIMETTIIWINTLDKDGNVTFWNKAAEKISGYTAEEVLGHAKIWDWVYPNPEYKAEIFKTAQSIIIKGERIENLETQIRGKDGQYRTILWHSHNLMEQGKVIGSIALGVDITERKLVEEDLRKISDEYEKVFHGTQDAMFLMEVIDADTFRYIRNNQAHQKTTGISIKDIMGKTPQELLGLELGNRIALNYSRCVQTESPVSYEETLDLPAGEHIWYTTLTPVFYQGKVNYIVGSSHNITQRKRTLRALHNSEEQYRSLIKYANEAIVIAQDNLYKLANPMAVKLFRRSEDELTSTPFTEFIHPDDLDMVLSQYNKRLRGEDALDRYFFRIKAADGSLITVEISAVGLEWNGRPASLCLLTDITHRKKIEEEIFKANKLESIGILAGGIAHDFNNYLATLQGNISLAKLYKNDSTKIGEKLEKIEKATIRAKDLTNQLFAFAIGGAPLKKKVFINDLIVDNVKFTLSGSNVTYNFFIDQNLHMVNIDEGQFGQVLNNIVINAVQAMPDGGTIEVSAENITINAENKDQFLMLKEGIYVKISIKDEGIGIPEQHLQKIFDPFFTTKHKGSGLGLATSYSIIKKHGGYLSAESKLGVGTTFFIFLTAFRHTFMTKTEERDIYYGTGKILLMDDEEEVLEVTAEMLSTLGYDVSLAKDGSEVIKLYVNAQKKDQLFDLVILDLTVPGGMGGKDTIKKLLKEDPHAKAIVYSGYSNDPVMANFKYYGFKGVLKKPFSIEELSKLIHEVTI